MHTPHRGLYVVMGVAGSGKSVIGAALASALAIDFAEGDRYHPPENVARMAAGIPLTDDDRWGWLRALGASLRDAGDAGRGLVVSCSALKRSYRDVLRREAAPHALRFIFMRGDRTLIAGRLAARRGHYMPLSLLDSQFETLQEPTADEEVWVCDIAQSPERIVDELVARATGTAG